MLDVSLLGTGGMMPLPNRFLTSLICRINGKLLLIDCGEGTQISLKMLGFGFKNIDVICFTHFHADHISGLPGLLLAIGNSERKEPLNIVGPDELCKVVKSLLVIAPLLPFEIIFHEFNVIEKSGVIFKELKLSEFTLSGFAMEHRIPCLAYRLDIKRLGKFDVLRAEKLGVPKKVWGMLQKNETVEYEGKIYTNDMVLGNERKGIAVSYCTDSRPVCGLSDFVKHSDLFICEGIYGEDEKFNKAVEYRHMLFSEAANIAKEAEVKELWLTHFSPSLTEPKKFLSAASNIFENTVVAYDRICKNIVFEQ